MAGCFAMAISASLDKIAQHTKELRQINKQWVQDREKSDEKLEQIRSQLEGMSGKLHFLKTRIDNITSCSKEIKPIHLNKRFAPQKEKSQAHVKSIIHNIGDSVSQFLSQGRAK